MSCNNNWLTVYYYSPITVVDKIICDIKSRENRNYQSQIVNTESSFYTTEKVHIMAPIEFGSKPVVMTCWNCQVPITTKTEKNGIVYLVFFVIFVMFFIAFFKQ